MNSLKKQTQPLSLQLLFVFTSCILEGLCIAAKGVRMTKLPQSYELHTKIFSQTSHKTLREPRETSSRSHSEAGQCHGSLLTAVLTVPYELCTQLSAKSNVHG